MSPSDDLGLEDAHPVTLSRGQLCTWPHQGVDRRCVTLASLLVRFLESLRPEPQVGLQVQVQGQGVSGASQGRRSPGWVPAHIPP